MFKFSQKGFSLIEILVALAVMVVVAGVAVPNYKKYFLNAKMTEAKTALGNVYMAEKSFFLEHRFYTSDLMAIGIAPDGERLYNVGFSTDSSNAGDSSSLTLDPSKRTFYKICGKNFDAGDVESCAFKNKKNPNGFIELKIPSGHEAKVNKFKAGAIADIISKTPTDKPANIDIWSINQYKVIKHEPTGPGGSY